MHRRIVDASLKVMMTAEMGGTDMVRIYTFSSASVTFDEIASLTSQSLSLSPSFGLPMKALTTLVLMWTTGILAGAGPRLSISPLPGSASVPVSPLVVLRLHDPIPNDVQVMFEGSRTGMVPAIVRRADDGYGANIKPAAPFLVGEQVHMRLVGSGLDTSFVYRIAEVRPVEEAAIPFEAPPDLFPLTVTVNNNPSPGKILVGPNNRTSTPAHPPYLALFNNDGTPFRWQRVAEFPFDVKPLVDGRFGYTVFTSAGSGAKASSNAFILDTGLQRVDEFGSGWGFPLAQHDFHLLPNGNRIMLCQENVIVDMRQFVAGGHPAASVTQAVVQEVRPDGFVVFQWRSLDHIPISASYEDLKAAAIRYIHNNSIDVDTDGNLLLSLRHCAAVVKVSRNTGDVLWIMGGKLNQFTFIDEHEENAPTYFSYQHHVIRLPNGNITMFDNGNLRSPQFSRCLEYEIDEQQKTARLVWEYRRTPDIFTQLQGAMQTLPNGNRLIAWGSAALTGGPSITEIDANNNVVFEATSQKDMYFYKASKIPWPYGAPSDSVMIAEILEGNTYNYNLPQMGRSTGVTITFDDAVFFGYNETVVRRFPYAPVNPGFPERQNGSGPDVLPMRFDFAVDGIFEHRVQLRFHADTLGIADRAPFITVYARDTVGRGTFRPLTTRFNATSREIIVDTARAGEYCFGIATNTGQPASVRLLSPIGGRSVAVNRPLQLRISPKGRVGVVKVEVSRTLDFSNPIVIPAANDYRFAFTPSELGPHYWRALNTIGTLEPVVSDTSLFVVEGESLVVMEPSASAVWTRDSSYVIGWKSNGGGLLKVEFVRNGERIALIRDSVPASAGALLFRVPSTVPAGTDYQIRITALDRPVEVYDVSVAFVTIVDGATSVDEVENTNITALPNPAGSVLHVSSVFEVHRIRLFAITGEGVLDHSTVGKGMSLDVSSVLPGSYVLYVESDAGIETRLVTIAR